MGGKNGILLPTLWDDLGQAGHSSPSRCSPRQSLQRDDRRRRPHRRLRRRWHRSCSRWPLTGLPSLGFSHFHRLRADGCKPLGLLMFDNPNISHSNIATFRIWTHSSNWSPAWPGVSGSLKARESKSLFFGFIKSLKWVCLKIGDARK